MKILLLSLSRQYTLDGQYIPNLFIAPEMRHNKSSYTWNRKNAKSIETVHRGVDKLKRAYATLYKSRIMSEVSVNLVEDNVRKYVFAVCVEENIRDELDRMAIS